MADRTSVPLHVNHARIASSRRPLDHLDLITVAGHTITVWDADGGGKGLRCPNTDCQLLNPYNPDENCAFCGAKLDAGQTFIVE